ncbi:hypothetical protein [Plasmodium yoelii yoelii]|uniref:Uncharacterized protein n=1 Tax=Plasmodium yoelii yoelii TaxID=73239 RepID=Q7RQX5_PLAYO|nr:hypothetical protein [Plasmodium yoelii yoelii]
MASKEILKIVLDKCRIPYNVLKLKKKSKQMENCEKKNKKIENCEKMKEKKIENCEEMKEKKIFESDKKSMENIQNKCDDIFYYYKKLKVFEKPFVYFNKLPCDFYFYYFQASNGDLCKYNDLLAPQSGEENIKPNINENNDNSRQFKQVYNNAFCTDTLKITIKNQPELNEKFNTCHNVYKLCPFITFPDFKNIKIS